MNCQVYGRTTPLCHSASSQRREIHYYDLEKRNYCKKIVKNYQLNYYNFFLLNILIEIFNKSKKRNLNENFAEGNFEEKMMDSKQDILQKRVTKSLRSMEEWFCLHLNPHIHNVGFPPKHFVRIL